MLIDFRQLFPKYKINPKGVLHIGANVGEERDVYLQLGVRKQIWIEANPDIFLKLRANISNNPDAEAFNYCIGDENKETVLHIANNAGQSSSVLSLGTHRNMHPDVHYIGDLEMRMHRIDSLGLDLSEVNFLNIDLQGAELMALKGMGELLNGFRWIYLEVNSDYVYEGCGLIGEVDQYLTGFGFNRVETKWHGRNTWGDSLYIKGSFQHA